MSKHTPYSATLHRDGSATYWSVYEQRWLDAEMVSAIPDREYAAMSDGDRERVLRHLRRPEGGAA